MAIDQMNSLVTGVSRQNLLRAVKNPELAPVSFKDLLKQLNQKLGPKVGFTFESPAEVLALKFLEKRFDKSAALKNKYGSGGFENFLKEMVDSGKFQKIADKIESKFKTSQSVNLNLESEEMQELAQEIDQELELSDQENYLSLSQFLKPATENDLSNQDWFQKAQLNIKESYQVLINQIKEESQERDRVDQKIREKRLANLEVEKKEIANAQLEKDQEMVNAKKIVNPLARMTEVEMVLSSFQSKKAQAGLQTA